MSGPGGRSPEALRLNVPGTGEVGALLNRPDGHSGALLVLAHGAGAGMEHAFMANLAAALTPGGIAVLRYDFPFVERGGWPPDRPPVAVATVRAAVQLARSVAGALGPPGEDRPPIFAGGKSFGGRMTARAAADPGLPGVEGLVLVAFPLHPEGRPEPRRAAALEGVRLPLLLLQGTRDRRADLEVLRPLVDRLGPAAHLHTVAGADHGFQVLKRSGRTAEEVMEELARTAGSWMRRRPGAKRRAERRA